MKRTFLGWDEPALPRAAAALVEHYTDGAEARMDRAVVALPGGRAGRRLKELLVEEAGRRELRLVPPRVVTVGALPELLYEPRRPVANAAVLRLAWARALRDVPAEELLTVFARRPDGDALQEWGALARELARLQRDVARGGHRFADVARLCGAAAAAGHVPWDDADRWEVLAGVQEAFQTRLDAMELEDPDLARLAALRDGRLHTDAEIWLVGVSQMPEVVSQALREVGGRIRVLVHAPEDRADAFDELGCVVPEAWDEAVIPLARDQLVVRDRPDHQADEVARALEALNGSRAADEIVVGVPDARVVPWIEERLSDAGVPVRHAFGHPLEGTGPYRLLAAAADFLGTRRFDAFAALARHPDVAEWVPTRRPEEIRLSRPGGWLEALDRWYSDHLPLRLSPPGDRLLGEGSREGRVVAALARLLDTELLAPLTTAPGFRPVSEWVGPVLEVLERVYGARDLDADRPADRRLLRELSGVAEAAHAFGSLPAVLDERCPGPTALRIFLEQAAGTVVPPDPARAAVELLGWLELHLDDAPVAVVTGVNEPHLPESVTADAFLPDGIRTRLGLVDNRTRYARDAYRLTAMLHSTSVLRLVSGRRTAAGDPLRPSRLLFAADPTTVARRVRHFYDREQGDERRSGGSEESPEQGEDAAGEVAPSAFVLPPEPEIRLSDPLVSLRVTDFRPLLGDPYAFALERFRGCEAVDDAARELDGLQFGGLAHRVLQDFGEDGDLVHRTDEAVVTARLEELLDARVRRRFGPGARNAHVAVRVQVEQLRARLRRFARWHVAWIADGWRVRAVECATTGDGVPFDVDGTAVGLRARIDRVDHHPDRAQWAVFDYKTGDRGEGPEDTHRTNRGKDWSDLQLPLYRWLLPRLVDDQGSLRFPDAGDTDVRVGYILLPRELESVGDALADWSEAEFAHALETARSVVRRLRAGVFTFDPDARPGYPDEEMDALLGRRQLGGVEEDER